MRVPVALLRSPSIRRGLRRCRQAVASAAYSVRSWFGRELAPRQVATPVSRAERLFVHPAILVVPPPNGGAETTNHWGLEQQTEASWTLDPRTNPSPPLLLALDGPLLDWPATHLEGLLLAHAAESSLYAVSGWQPLTSGEVAPLELPNGEIGSATLFAREATDHPGLGRLLPHPTSTPPETARAVAPAGAQIAHRSLLRDDVKPGTLVRKSCQPVHRALQGLPPIDGPRTVLFVVPFLAVGGAERLLLQLIEGLQWEDGAEGASRCLIACLEPHDPARGQTLDEARALTPHVYPLGDWLPREALGSALRHLIRRYRVQTLFGWNGATDLYDQFVDLRRDEPQLRIVNQLFNHEGGWFEHYSAAISKAVDLHVGINSRIAAALRDRWSIPPDRLAEIHHAIALPSLPSAAERTTRRQARRSELGIPEGTVVVGSFLRLHPQKRPLDIVAIAERLADEKVHFLLVGGGLLDEALDRALAERSLSNFTRLPLQADPSPLFDALDLCLLTSAYEGLPLFLLEGLARELPVVAPAVGDIPYLLEAGGGIVVDRPGDIAGYIAAIRSLRDPDLRRNHGVQGRRRVEADFSLPRYVDDYRQAIFPQAEAR